MQVKKKTDQEKTETCDSKEKRMYAGWLEYLVVVTGAVTAVLLGKLFALDFFHKIGLFMGRDLPDSVLSAMLFTSALIVCYVMFNEFETEPEEGGFTLLKDFGYFLLVILFTFIYMLMFLVIIGVISVAKGILSHYGVGYW